MNKKTDALRQIKCIKIKLEEELYKNILNLSFASNENLQSLLTSLLRDGLEFRINNLAKKSEEVIYPKKSPL